MIHIIYIDGVVVVVIMIKEYDGIPRNFKGMGWSSQLTKIGISLQQIFNPFNMQIGLNYKSKTKNKSIVWDNKAAEEKAIKTSARIIRLFEKKHFNIPNELSAYQ